MNRAFPRAASACTLVFGLSLGGMAWADTATLPPGPLIDINYTGNSLGTATDAATTKSNSLTGNTVTLTSGAVDGYVVGAINQEDDAAVTGNKVYINGGTVGRDVYGGWAASAVTAVSNNTVSISDGSVSGNVAGGFGYVTVTGNSVTISGGTVSKNVLGAALRSALGAPNPPSISNNTVTISGTPTFSPTTITGTTLAGYSVICGVGLCMAMLPETFVNNTLKLYSTGLAVANVLNFNNLEFHLPASLSAGTPVLAVTDSASLSVNTAPGGVITTIETHISVDSTTAATLNEGDTYTLIQAGTLNLPTGFTPITGTIKDATGATFDYTVDVDASGNNLVLKIGNSAPPVPPSASAAAVPATGPAALALLALLLAATGWLTRRGARR